MYNNLNFVLGVTGSVILVGTVIVNYPKINKMCNNLAIYNVKEEDLLERAMNGVSEAFN